MTYLCHENLSLCCHSSYSWQNIGRMNVLSVRWPAHSTNLEAAISRYVWIWYHVSLISRAPLFCCCCCCCCCCSACIQFSWKWKSWTQTKEQKWVRSWNEASIMWCWVMSSFLGLLLSFSWSIYMTILCKNPPKMILLHIVRASLCSKGCIAKLSLRVSMP